MSGNIFSLCKRWVISQSQIRSACSAFIVPRFVLPVIVLFMIAEITGRAQIVYSQNFNSTTLAGSGWTNTNLTMPWASGSFLGLNNNWYVNDAESGMPANTCGTAGAGNPTLYMGAVGLGALGAAYLSNASTNRRISSPNINTAGYSGMTLSFNFIANGYQNTDKAYFQYSVDGGTTWITPAGSPTSTTPALQAGSSWSNLKSQVCASTQGRWTNVTWAMPAACENIPNLRIGFVWQNNSSTGGNAADPCLAIDDIVISVILAPVELSAFEVRCENSMAVLEWTTRSENNNDFFTLETSTDFVHWQMLTRVSGSGNSGEAKYYSFRHPAPGSVVYYKLSQTDFDGRDTPLRIISLTECLESFGFSIYPNPASDFINIRGDNPAAIHFIRIYDRFGRLVVNSAAGNYEGSQIQYRLPSSITPGLYVVYLQTAEGDVEEFKLMVE